MKTFLLDVNVLFSLLWRGSEGYAAAHSWFQEVGFQSWSTTPTTQLGLLRLLTNPALTESNVSAATAMEMLQEAIQHRGHQFWPLTSGMLSLQPIVQRIRGHRQWPDALLLQLAVARAGVFVTFDGGVRELTIPETATNLLVLKARRPRAI